MIYKTMNRKELAIELEISKSTLSRKMEKALSPEFRIQIKGRSLLFENEVKHIYEKVTNRKKQE